MKLKSKAQMETMGLLVIVILVSLILFFVLMFNINKEKTEVVDKKDFTKTQAVSNFGTTMLETTVNCAGNMRTIRELLTDCGFTNEIYCGDYNSCLAAEHNISNILSLTLDTWGYEYNLTVQKNQADVLSIVSGCDGARSSSLERTPFGTTRGTMVIEIKTCERN